MAQILEALMIICFGLSWPTNILKSYRARTARGKSLLFLVFVFVGYWFGIAAKIYTKTVNYVCLFYIVNSAMVLIDILLYFRNNALDRRTA